MTPPPLPKIKTYAYEDIRGSAAMTRIFLGLCTLGNLALIFTTALQWRLFARGAFTEAEGDANDHIMEVTSYFRIAFYILAGVSVMYWSYRAHVNARSQGALGLTTEPGIVACSYIIPFVNLWVPFQSMRELWKHSFPAPANQGTPPLLVLWWTSWLLSLFLGNFVTKFIRVTDLRSGIYASQAQIVWLLCSLASGVLLYVIVTRISADQAERRRQAVVASAESRVG